MRQVVKYGRATVLDRTVSADGQWKCACCGGGSRYQVNPQRKFCAPCRRVKDKNRADAWREGNEAYWAKQTQRCRDAGVMPFEERLALRRQRAEKLVPVIRHLQEHDQLSFEQIAQQLGLTRNVVAGMLHRAKVADKPKETQ